MRNRWKYILKILKTKGLFYCLRKAFYFIIGQIEGIIAYPICRFMNVKFISIHVSAIGHFAGELECYVNEGILGLRPQYKAIMLVSDKELSNPHLLNYWKKYVWVIRNPILRFLFGPLRRSALTRYDIEKYFCGDYREVAFPDIQKKCIGRQPVLCLMDFDRKRGLEALRKMKIPEGAWFVCVHCRESGQIGQRQHQSLRDVDVNSYFLAMNEIVERGGWVIRMGDASMKTIPPMKGVIDYAHLALKSDWMDIFLCASCKFFLGSNSGLSNLASIFGRSSVITNIAGPVSAVLPYGPDDIGIPKLIWSIKDKRYLTFTEIFNSPIGNFREDYLHSGHGIRTVENSPEDIREVALEMFNRLSGELKYSEEDERMQERFKALMNPSHFSYGSVSRVGRDFLRKYKYLLTGAEKI